MQKIEVFGANKLKGTIKISGSKNSSLPILAASLLTDKRVKIKNLPKVRDIETMIKLLQTLGSKVKFTNNQSMSIDNSDQNKKVCFIQLSKNYESRYFSSWSFTC